MKRFVFVTGFDVMYDVFFFFSVTETSEVQTAGTETLPHSAPPDAVAHGPASHDSSTHTDSLNTSHGTFFFFISMCLSSFLFFGDMSYFLLKLVTHQKVLSGHDGYWPSKKSRFNVLALRLDKPATHSVLNCCRTEEICTFLHTWTQILI